MSCAATFDRLQGVAETVCVDGTTGSQPLVDFFCSAGGLQVLVVDYASLCDKGDVQLAHAVPVDLLVCDQAQLNMSTGSRRHVLHRLSSPRRVLLSSAPLFIEVQPKCLTAGRFDQVRATRHQAACQHVSVHVVCSERIR